MKLRRYLDKDQPENSICLMSIMNIKFKHIQPKEMRAEGKNMNSKEMKSKKERIEKELEKTNKLKNSNLQEIRSKNIFVKMEENEIKINNKDNIRTINHKHNQSEVFDIDCLKNIGNNNNNNNIRRNITSREKDKISNLLTDRKSNILPNLQMSSNKNISCEKNESSNLQTDNSQNTNKNNSILYKSVNNINCKNAISLNNTSNIFKSQMIESNNMKASNFGNFPIINISQLTSNNQLDNANKNISSLIPLEQAMKKIDMKNNSKRTLKSAAKTLNNEFILNKIYSINDKLSLLDNNKIFNSSLLNYCQESLSNLNASVNNLNTSTKIAQALKEINVLNEYYTKLNNQKIRQETVEKAKFLNKLKNDFIKESNVRNNKEFFSNNLNLKKNNHDSKSLETKVIRNNDIIRCDKNQSSNNNINAVASSTSTSKIINLVNSKIKTDAKHDLQSTLQCINDDKFVYEVICLKDLEIISKIMKHRSSWILKNNNKSEFINFTWKYSNKKVPFSSFNLLSSKIKTTKSFNHLEFHYEMTNKKFFFSNLIEYCDNKNIDPFNIVPFTVIINKSKVNQNKNFNSFKEIYENLSIHIKKENNNDFVYGNYGKLFTISDKQSKVKNIKCKIPNCYSLGKNLWILKPDNLYQGKLIKISDTLEEIIKDAKAYINVKSIKDESIKLEKNENLDEINVNEIDNFNSKSKSKIIDVIKEEFVVSDEENYNVDNKTKKKKKKSVKFVVHNLLIQKYIENPLLFNNRKFDIRVFILIDHQSNLYIFKEGHLKTSSEVYDVSTKHTFVHITNYSLQKYNPNFEKYEKGNELGFDDFQIYLDSNNIPINVRKDIMPKIKEKVRICVESCSKKLFRKPITYTFELYGIDLILDNNFCPYIFEINDNPGLTISSPIIEILIPRILDDMFRLTIDTIYDVKNAPLKSQFSVNGYTDEENMFEKICSLI